MNAPQPPYPSPGSGQGSQQPHPFAREPFVTFIDRVPAPKKGMGTTAIAAKIVTDPSAPPCPPVAPIGNAGGLGWVHVVVALGVLYAASALTRNMYTLSDVTRFGSDLYAGQWPVRSWVVPAIWVSAVATIVIWFVVTVRLGDANRKRRDDQAKLVSHWTAEYQIRCNGVSTSVRTTAVQIYDVVEALSKTAAHKDGWIGEEWAPAVHAWRWTLLVRLRDSIPVRDRITEARKLSVRTPELDQAVATQTRSIRKLDADVRAELKQLEDALALANELDIAVKIQEQARADLERSAELARHLDGTTATAAETDREQRRFRDEALADSAAGDLSILIAQLRALTQHMQKT